MDRRIHRLSADHFRAFVMSLVWSVSNRTDGVILPEDLVLIPGFGRDAPAALVGQKLWEERPEGWLILDYAAHQTTRSELEVLENARRRDRLKKQKQRANKSAGSASVPGDVPGDESPATAQEGQARTGQARHVREPDLKRDSAEKHWKHNVKPRRPCGWCSNGSAFSTEDVCPQCHQHGEKVVA